MPTSDHPLILLLALFAALMINAIGLTTLDYLVGHPPGRWSLLPSAPLNEEENEDAETNAPDEDEPAEPKFLPGIESGVPATVTWIGYNEYQEHLAELAEVEQALFTMADGGVVGQPVPLAEPRVDPVPLAEPLPVEELVAAATKAAALTNAAEPAPIVNPELSTPIEIAARTVLVDDAEPTVVASKNSESPVSPSLAAESAPAVKVAASALVPEAIAEAAAENVAVGVSAVAEKIEPIREADPEPVAEVPTRVPPVSGTTDKPSPDPRDSDTVPTDKEVRATSLKPVPEIAWNAGKPLAVEGLEIKPYSLTRHIIIDAKDRLFRLKGWGGRIKRNPLVSLQFDRFGNLAKLRIVRDTGYADFDQRYLKSWLARWTARDKRLAELAENEMTNPIVLKLKFIDEPEKEQKNGKMLGNGAKTNH